MATRVIFEIGSERLHAEFNDSETAKEIVERLPIEIKMSRWGDEYYGSIGVTLKLSSDAKDIMEVGEIAYWPSGDTLCIFFGPTPASTGSEPRAASAVNPVGRLIDSPVPLKKMGRSISVRLAKA